MALSPDVLSKLLQDAEAALSDLQVSPKAIEAALDNVELPTSLEAADAILEELGVPMTFPKVKPSKEPKHTKADSENPKPAPPPEPEAKTESSKPAVPVLPDKEPDPSESMNELFVGFDEREEEGSMELTAASLSSPPASLDVDIDPPDDSIFPTAPSDYFNPGKKSTPKPAVDDAEIAELDIDELELLDPEEDEDEEDSDLTMITPDLSALESVASAQEDGASPSTIPLAIESEDEDPDDPDGDKKGFFKKLFGN